MRWSRRDCAAWSWPTSTGTRARCWGAASPSGQCLHQVRVSIRSVSLSGQSLHQVKVSIRSVSRSGQSLCQVRVSVRSVSPSGQSLRKVSISVRSASLSSWCHLNSLLLTADLFSWCVCFSGSNIDYECSCFEKPACEVLLMRRWVIAIFILVKTAALENLLLRNHGCLKQYVWDPWLELVSNTTNKGSVQ